MIPTAQLRITVTFNPVEDEAVVRELSRYAGTDRSRRARLLMRLGAQALSAAHHHGHGPLPHGLHLVPTAPPEPAAVPAAPPAPGTAEFFENLDLDVDELKRNIHGGTA